ncbi:Mitogen-activated protein kinase kinase kinase 1 [Glycine soja]|nr:Mitogen-activated protein kinase kinase kinase 1 [Glycine soja]
MENDMGLDVDALNGINKEEGSGEPSRDQSKLYIFLEIVTKGSLRSLYQKYTLRDSQVSFYTRQILHGLKYLHDRNAVHRDIICANILVDASGFVKLADFGLAKATKLNDVKSMKRTTLWMVSTICGWCRTCQECNMLVL